MPPQWWSSLNHGCSYTLTFKRNSSFNFKNLENLDFVSGRRDCSSGFRRLLGRQEPFVFNRDGPDELPFLERRGRPVRYLQLLWRKPFARVCNQFYWLFAIWYLSSAWVAVIYLIMQMSARAARSCHAAGFDYPQWSSAIHLSYINNNTIKQ